MSRSIVELFDLSSEGLGKSVFSATFFKNYGELGEQLRLLLSDVNGFYAFESSLHVIPIESEKHYTDIVRWNESGLWKNHYGQNLGLYLFFAEDVFGGQFCIYSDSIYYFEPETGDMEWLANSLDDWAKLMVENFNLRTGFPLGHKWQLENGALPMGQRLIPKIPFILGGDFSTKNLVAYDSIKGMRLRGDLAKQIKNLPDGSQIMYKIEQK